MKKTEFYSVVKRNKQKVAELQKGYTDGKYNYYRNKATNTWYAIDPLTGFSFATADTRKAVEEKANSRIKMLNDMRGTKDYKRLLTEFNELKEGA